MAKTNTEAAPKKAAKKEALKKEAEKPFQRPLMDEPEDAYFSDPDPVPKGYPIGSIPKIEITKGKLLKGDKIEIEYTKQDGAESKPAECSEKHTDPPRKQFKNAFADLAIHAALIGEFIPLTKIKDITKPDVELTKDFQVSGFTIVGEDDDAGVILTAHKILKSGKALGFNTPTIRFNDQSENAYPHLEELAESIDVCKDEIREYLNGKHAEDPQGKLDLK